MQETRVWSLGQEEPLEDVRVIWMQHLSPHWSPGLIQLIWLARRVSPSSLTAPYASLQKLRAWSKRITIPDRGDPVFGQGHMSSCIPLLEPPNKLSRKNPWRREWQPTPVTLPGKFHGQRSLVGFSPWDHRVRHNWATNIHFFIYANVTSHWIRSDKYLLCLVTQSCPTLWDPTDCSLLGSSVCGNSSDRNTGVGCHTLLQGIFPTQG